MGPKIGSHYRLLFTSRYQKGRFLKSFFKKNYRESVKFTRKVSINEIAESTYSLRIPLTSFADSRYIFWIPLTFCGIHSQLRNLEPLAIFAYCGIQKRNADKIYEIHLHFGTGLKICLWNPGTYRHKSVRLSSAQFSLVISLIANLNFLVLNFDN